MERIYYGLVTVAGAFIVPAFQFFYGEGNVRFIIMTLMCLVIALDWIAGIRASKRDDTYASEYGIDGIYRTVFILFLPAVGNLLDTISNLPGVVFGLISFGIIYHVLQSMIANTVRAGWDRWVPQRVIELVSSEIENKIARSMERKNEKISILKGDEKNENSSH